MNEIRISDSAIVEHNVTIGEGTVVWHNSQLRNGSSIGRDCIIGKDVYIGTGVKVGNQCKIQNGAQIYEPARLASGVFIGPQVVLTNDRRPRAVRSDGTLKSAEDWELVGVTIEQGASIGANSTCIAPIRIGEWAMIGAGSVVIEDVPNYALVVGNPGRQIGWVSESGERLIPNSETEFICPSTQTAYFLIDGELRPRI